MIRGYRVWDNQEKTYSDKAFSIDQFGLCYVQDEDGYWEELDEERYVVEQYIGLEDRNGKGIHEGDIVKISNLKPIFEVKYSIPFAEFLMETNGELYEEFQCWNEKEAIEVIGNIHEDKELLGGEE